MGNHLGILSLHVAWHLYLQERRLCTQKQGQCVASAAGTLSKEMRRPLGAAFEQEVSSPPFIWMVTAELLIHGTCFSCYFL